MSWTIIINSIGLELVFDGKLRRIEGAKTSQIVNSQVNENDSWDFCNQLSNGTCVWMITSSSIPISTYCFSDSQNEDLSKSLSTSESNTAAEIKNYGEEYPSISIWIVVSQETFEELWNICKMLYSQPSLSLLVSMNFLGFKRDGVEHPAPTVSEFKKGKPYYCDNVFIKLINKSTGVENT